MCGYATYTRPHTECKDTHRILQSTNHQQQEKRWICLQPAFSTNRTINCCSQTRAQLFCFIQQLGQCHWTANKQSNTLLTELSYIISYWEGSCWHWLASLPFMSHQHLTLTSDGQRSTTNDTKLCQLWCVLDTETLEQPTVHITVTNMCRNK